jgi:hypothetical protein
LVWFGLVWFGLVWFGLVWFGLVWFGLVWFGWSVASPIVKHVVVVVEVFVHGHLGGRPGAGLSGGKVLEEGDILLDGDEV